MNLFHCLKWTAVGLSCIGFVFPRAIVAADRSPHRASNRTAPHRPVVTDVSLASSGVLQGRIVDSNGNGLKGITVQLISDTDRHPATVTNLAGLFQIRDLRSGVYRVQTDRGGTLLRLWDARIAPPNARESLILVDQSRVVRGQDIARLDTDWDGKEDRTLNLTEAAILVTSVTAIAIAGVAIQNSNDVEDKIEQLPFTP